MAEGRNWKVDVPLEVLAAFRGGNPAGAIRRWASLAEPVLNMSALASALSITSANFSNKMRGRNSWQGGELERLIRFLGRQRMPATEHRQVGATSLLAQCGEQRGVKRRFPASRPGRPPPPAAWSLLEKSASPDGDLALQELQMGLAELARAVRLLQPWARPADVQALVQRAVSRYSRAIHDSEFPPEPPCAEHEEWPRGTQVTCGICRDAVEPTPRRCCPKCKLPWHAWLPEAESMAGED